MMSSSPKGMEVFDFKEEDEVIESAAARFMGKFGKSKADSSAISKYEFLECFAQGTNVHQTEISNVPCLDVDASDSDHKCNNSVSYALGTSVGDCVVKEGIPGLDPVLQSNSMSSEPHAHCSPDNLEYGSILPRVNSPAAQASSPGILSAGNKQLSCTLPESPSNNEPVDVISDESMNASSPSTSDFELTEREVSSEERASDHCFSGWQIDDINTAVVFPDYIICGHRYCTESMLTFSCSCIKLEGSIAYGNKETFNFEWEIADVISIESQWCGRVETAMVKLCVKPKDAVGDENVHGTSGIEELKFAVCDHNWSETQVKITSLDPKYKAIWNVVLDTDMAREEDAYLRQDSLFFSKHYFSNCDKPFEDVIYPRGDPDAVSICKRDVELLQPETFINDTIIDFYIKYLKNKIQPEEKHRFHFFNSFFFRKLADLDKDPSSASEGRAAFQRVRKWTRKVNLFEKDYIFIPVNFNLHWSLIVICHPGEVANFKDEETDKSFKVPCILHMDSIKGSHKGLKNLVQSYLWEEWKERQKETSEDVSSKFLNLRFVSLELPQQENSFDCGLFLLHYVELFLEDTPVNFSPFKITKFSTFLNMDWFPPAEASLKRALIRKLIYELLEDYSQEIHPTACRDEDHSFEFPENSNKKEIGVQLLEERCSQEKMYHGNSSCSSADQGIEITLLATSPPRGIQCVRDSGLVFRELFESGATTGSFPDGQYRSFDQIASFHRFNGAMSPIEEEDAETSEQFVYSPSGETSCQRLAGITNGACITSYSAKEFIALQTSWNREISEQPEEYEEGDSSPEKSMYGSQDSSEVGVDEYCQLSDNVGLTQQEEMGNPRLPSPVNIECMTGSPASASSEGAETCVVEDSQETDRIPDSNERVDPPSSCQENHIMSSIQEADLTDNMDLTGIDLRLSSDDPVSESDEQQAAKRRRLTPPPEGAHS